MSKGWVGQGQNFRTRARLNARFRFEDDDKNEDDPPSLKLRWTGGRNRGITLHKLAGIQDTLRVEGMFHGAMKFAHLF